MEIVLSSIATIISVIIGGLITYYVSQREIKRNKKLEIYLDFLHIAHGRYFLKTSGSTEEYMNILRKLYLVGSFSVLKAIEESGYMPKVDKDNIKWSNDDPANIEQPLKIIILAMRKDVGDYNHKLEQLDYVNWFFKEIK